MLIKLDRQPFAVCYYVKAKRPPHPGTSAHRSLFCIEKRSFNSGFTRKERLIEKDGPFVKQPPPQKKKQSPKALLMQFH